MPEHKGGKTQRKYGRNRPWCRAYRLRNQRERNKLRKLRRHLLKFPGDDCAIYCTEKIRTTLGTRWAS